MAVRCLRLGDAVHMDPWALWLSLEASGPVPDTLAGRDPQTLCALKPGPARSPPFGLACAARPFRPFTLCAIVGSGVALPYAIQALRLLRFPKEARILVLSGLYVVFVPHDAFVLEEKVFVSGPF